MSYNRFLCKSDRSREERKSNLKLSSQVKSLLVRHHPRKVALLLLAALSTSPGFAGERVDLSGSRIGTAPKISYKISQEHNRHLIFLNNPEFLWHTAQLCDLADPAPMVGRNRCGKSLFRIDRVGPGSYRAWWEHRNMMPFSVHSGLLISNPTQEVSHVILANDAIETDSFQKGGSEFAQILNSNKKNTEITLAPGERRFLGHTQNHRIHSTRFFAGVADFDVVSGEISLEEVVFRNRPAEKLIPMGYSDRQDFNVHESLVYKGVSEVSAVTLTGAEFTISDDTLRGDLPVQYNFHEVSSGNEVSSSCQVDRLPACIGRALKPHLFAQTSNSWVTHIAPDPLDTNPKRKRAIVDDLIELTLPASSKSCASQWPQTSNACLKMSANHFWFLNDFQKWRLPNWGNWAVHYTHPIKIVNTGNRTRFVRMRITADGASPLAYKGSGVSSDWQQIFLEPNPSATSTDTIIVARGILPAQGELELRGEFVLSGPGAGTLEHRIELLESEDDF